ncbi:hypothetical protein [Dethiosulfatarculus sandiegensis]|uniref:Uncharacterized protein n=1 Tax=Dethiosulfatarculus sandiegensis TaxID=1429043 RepID=A0A0D2JJ96_9BACT|nr:hypothetical protein [Dethiosulfatarculus sandiegensis]KIX15751.1 hypothetical protein X474_03020 [Dethiosulfatarculus sandiegensis]
MTSIELPSPDSNVKVEITMPLKLWWKLMETAQQNDMKLNYLIFKNLADAADYDINGESYDLLLREIEEDSSSPG